MRITEAMDRADRMRPNAVHQYDKRLSLYKLECQFADMMGLDEPTWELDSNEDYDLLIPDPHSQVYPYHLMAFIDFAQEETDLYQIDMIMANQELSDVQSWWRRNNREKDDTKFKGVFI